MLTFAPKVTSPAATQHWLEERTTPRSQGQPQQPGRGRWPQRTGGSEQQEGPGGGQGILAGGGDRR